MSDSWIILCAHHCAPGMGSEHAVGYNFLRELAQHHKILLITEDNAFRPSVEEEIARWNAAGACVQPYFVHHGARSDGRKNNLRLWYYLTYTRYQWKVFALARRLCAEHRVAVIHQLTIVGFREPGFCWLIDRPFVWGPVGGAVFAPSELFAYLSPKMRAFQAARGFVTSIQFYLSPRVRLAFMAANRRGGRFVAATHDIGRRFTGYLGGTYVRVPETGATLRSAPAHPRPRSVRPLRLLWVGALIDIKPLGLLLDALSVVRKSASDIELDVVGDGDSGASFRKAAIARGIKVNFRGWLEYEVVQRMYADSDLFVLLSMKDLTTNVVFEALGASLPVLCLDHHGYSEIVDDTCGFKIPVGTKDSMIQAIAALLMRLAADRSELEPKMKGAFAKAAEFTWERNAAVLSKIYEEAHNECSSRTLACDGSAGGRPASS